MTTTTKFERMNSIVEVARKSIDYQVYKNHQTWGVNFLPKQNTVLVLTPLCTLEVEGLTEVQEYVDSIVENKNMIAEDGTVFYSYFTEKVAYSSISRPAVEIMDNVISSLETNTIGTFNINALLNVMNNVNPEIWNKCRLVFAQGFKREGTAPIKFGNDNGRPVFSIRGINKPCVIVDGDDCIPAEYVKPNETYECALEQTESEILIRALKKFGLIKFGVHISEKYFNPEILPRLNNFEIIPDDLTSTTNKAELPKDRPMSPFHLAMPLFYDMLIMIRSMACENVNIHFPADSNTKPCVIEAVNKDGLKIRSIIAPLNQTFGIQRR